MAGVSMGTGLASGIDYSSMISQLMQIEKRPQLLLGQQLSASKADAAAYREINTAFATLGSAAQALTRAATWSSAKATSTDSSVTVTATSSAPPGSFTFTVDNLATAHSVTAGEEWANSTDDFGLGSTLTVKSTDGSTTFGTIAVRSSDGGGASLDDAVAAINTSGLGLSAAAVKTTQGYVLQVSATATGAGKAFQIQSDTDATGSNYSVATKGVDAQVSFPNPAAPADTTKRYTSTSPTNTFDGVLPGTTFSVTKPGVTSTISVATDPDAATNAVQSFVTAANNLLSRIKDKTDSSTGSTAALKGNSSVTGLASQVRALVSSAVAGTATTTGDSTSPDVSAAVAGLELNRDGTLTFTAATFKAKLAADPSLVQKIFSGATGVGTDRTPGTPDDTVDVDGIGARLEVLAERASDSVAGVLTQMANGQDTRVKDLQKQIDAWGLRLEQRQATLTAQFNAMEKALGTLNSQASWLTSQLAQLPSWSSTNKS